MSRADELFNNFGYTLEINGNTNKVYVSKDNPVDCIYFNLENKSVEFDIQNIDFKLIEATFKKFKECGVE